MLLSWTAHAATAALVSPDDLRAFRRDQGWTQVVFADRLGVSKRTVQAWERGTRPAPAMLTLALVGLQSLMPE